MTGLTITLDGETLRTHADRLRALLADLRPLMVEIGGYLEFRLRRRFEEGKGPGDVPWKPSLRAKLQGGQTLVDRGHLRDSLSTQATSTEAVVGVNRIYAAIHQFGGVIRAKSPKGLRFRLADKSFRRVQQVTIPARPFLGIDARDQERIRKVTSTYIDRAIGAGAG